MSLKRVTRGAAVGLVLASGALAVAGSANADEPENDIAGADNASSAQGPSAANDITPAGVPIFGLLESLERAPQRLSPEPEPAEER